MNQTAEVARRSQDYIMGARGGRRPYEKSSTPKKDIFPEHDGVQAAHYGVSSSAQANSSPQAEHKYVSPDQLAQQVKKRNRAIQENALKVYRETGKSPLPYGMKPDGA